MRRYILLVALIIPALSLAMDGTMILGEGFSFLFKAPQGWVIDANVASGLGIDMALYPEGSSWNTAVSVMYVRVKKTRESLDTFVKNDIEDFRANCPDIQVQSETPSYKSDYPLQMKRFVCKSGAAPGGEIVAYLDVGKLIVVWVASSRTETQLKTTRPAFEQVLKDFKKWDVVFDRKTRDKIHNSGDNELRIVP